MILTLLTAAIGHHDHQGGRGRGGGTQESHPIKDDKGIGVELLCATYLLKISGMHVSEMVWLPLLPYDPTFGVPYP